MLFKMYIKYISKRMISQNSAVFEERCQRKPKTGPYSEKVPGCMWLFYALLACSFACVKQTWLTHVLQLPWAVYANSGTSAVISAYVIYMLEGDAFYWHDSSFFMVGHKGSMSKITHWRRLNNKSFSICVFLKVKNAERINCGQGASSTLPIECTAKLSYQHHLLNSWTFFCENKWLYCTSITYVVGFLSSENLIGSACMCEVAVVFHAFWQLYIS
jgi:hypothetical protein